MPLPPISAPLTCETRSIEIEQLTQSALRLYDAGNTPDFYATLGNLEESLVCLREPLSPEQVGQLHLLYGIARVRAYDDAGGADAFRAAYEASPNLSVPPWLLELEAQRSRLDAARLAAPSLRRPIVAPPGTRVLVDGVVSMDRPIDRPYVLQVQWTSDGEVHLSAYMPASRLDPQLALYAPLAEATPCPGADQLCAPCPACVEPRPPLSPALVSSTIAANALTAGLVAAASWRYERFVDATSGVGAEGDPDVLKSQATALAIASGVTGAVAVGLDIALLARTFRDARESR